MKKVQTIRICTDFSDAPGGRYKSEGEHSGQEFREDVLLPKLREAVKEDGVVLIDFDGCYGFGTSFLEEAFGGIVRESQKKGIMKYLEIKSKEDETIGDLIKKYITDAEGRIPNA